MTLYKPNHRLIHAKAVVDKLKKKSKITPEERSILIYIKEQEERLEKAMLEITKFREFFKTLDYLLSDKTNKRLTNIW